jgi:hypothetical protein
MVRTAASVFAIFSSKHIQDILCPDFYHLGSFSIRGNIFCTSTKLRVLILGLNLLALNCHFFQITIHALNQAGLLRDNFDAQQWRAEDYISFVCRFMLGMGLGFELPVVILTLVKIGVLGYSTLRGMWRYMIVINLILGAVLTTPEVVTQVLMAVPLYLLYEITVWIAWYWDRQEKKRAVSEP